MTVAISLRREIISSRPIEAVGRWQAGAGAERRPTVSRNAPRTGSLTAAGTTAGETRGRVGDDMNALLLAVAAQADKAAFQALFEHFAPRVKAFMLRQGTDASMAEEVVQETMVNVWRKAGQFDPAKASASTWVFTIARNLRIDLIRKAKRPAPDMNDPAMVPDPEPKAHELIAQRQEAARLRSVMDGLPREQREVLHLAFYEEMAHGRVAEELGIPLGTVKSRIRLAFKRMRSELGEME